MTIRRIGKRANLQGMRFRPSLQDTKRASLAAQQAMSGPQTSEAGRANISALAASVKPKIPRIRRERDSTAPRLESDVQRDIIKFLLQHPAVAMVERINSGAVYGAENQFIKFHHLMLPHHDGKRPPMRVVDLSVTLRNAKRMVIECKREGWSKPSDEREREQQNYLRYIAHYGGIGIFATSVEDVSTALVVAGY